MSERFEQLSVEKSPLYTKGSPVIISASALLKDTTSGKIVEQIKFENISDKVIKALYVDVLAYSINDDELEGVKDFQYLDLRVKKSDIFGSRTPYISSG